jgi:tellurite resistance protein/uncharacterized protein (DUF697 family)
MNDQAAQAIVRIAAIASLADGAQDERERGEIAAIATRYGTSINDVQVTDEASAAMEAARVARSLTSAEEREIAYRVALAVCHADGYVNTRETLFLRSLAQTLDVDPIVLDTEAGDVSRDVESWVSPAGAAHAAGLSGAAGAAGALDDLILDQAILTAALELLPDKLANLGIIPLQLRLVHTIGQRSGAAVDGVQVKDLMATLGLSVVGQALETAVRKTFGGLVGGMLGRMLGGAGGVAAGAAVTFGTTYALGHVAEQYYAQGRRISTTDLKALFGRFKGEAETLYPRVQQRIADKARGNTMASLLQSVRGDLRGA